MLNSWLEIFRLIGGSALGGKINKNSMLQIRLLRVGKKHKPSFRLVLVNKGERPGKYLENLGFYTPTKKENKTENIKNDRITYWISKGAQLTPTVHNILLDARVITGKKEKIKISKKPASSGSAEGGKGTAEAPKAAAPKVEVKAEEKPAPSTNSGQAA